MNAPHLTRREFTAALGGIVLSFSLVPKVALVQEPIADPLPYRLISRRLASVHNSSWHTAPNLAKREPYNAAYMNPRDLAALQLPLGGKVEIRSRHASVVAIAQPSEDVRRGVVSISHCWGDMPGRDGDPNAFGTSVASVVSASSRSSGA